MSPQEKNNKRCKEYYLKTKDNLSEKTKQKRREQAKLRSANFYLRNRELCIKRSVESRRKNNQAFQKVNPKKVKTEILNNNNSKISNTQIKFIKSFNLLLIMRKRPRLRVWDKKLSDWNINDFKKFKKLTN